MATHASLTKAKIIGFERREYKAAPDAPSQPGGSCWKCGEALINCVIITHPEADGPVTIGTTCATYVGLTDKEVSEVKAQFYANLRDTERAASHKERMAAIEAEHGPHGTATRYAYGCDCDECDATVEHGTEGRAARGCECLPCSLWLVANRDDWEISDMPVLVDIETGQVLDDARQVDARYGARWRSDNADVWAAVSPARRATNLKNGVIEATADAVYHVINKRNGGIWYRPIHRITTPLFDNWGERIGS